MSAAPRWFPVTVTGADVSREHGELAIIVTLQPEGRRAITDRFVVAGRRPKRILTGQKRLASLCHAAGRLELLRHTDQFVGWRVLARSWAGKLKYAPLPPPGSW